MRDKDSKKLVGSFIAVVLALSYMPPSSSISVVSALTSPPPSLFPLALDDSSSTLAADAKTAATIDQFEPTFGGDGPFVARASASGLNNLKEPIKREEQTPLTTILKGEGAVPLRWIQRHLSTKSPYPHEDRPVGILDDIPDGYELAQVQLINRHGTRYPSASKSTAFKALTDKLKKTNVHGLDWLQQWSSEKMYPIAKGNLLAAQGDSDLFQIGSRYAIRYETHLDRHPYDANTYEFRSSDKSRCSQSAYAYSLGLLQGRRVLDPGPVVDRPEMDTPPVQPVNIFTLPNGLDQELAVKYACPRWLDNVKGQPNVLREERLYKESVLPKIVSRVSSLFTTPEGTNTANITAKDVESIYSLCGYEVSFYGQDQTWCQLLQGQTEDETRETFLQLEIAKDLDDYYTHGPGVPFNKHLGCRLGTAIQESIENILGPNQDNTKIMKKKQPGGDGTVTKGDDEDEDPPADYKFVFKFGHSETIFFFSSFLGLYGQGLPLSSTMTNEQFEERQFRSSEISPFAANMAFEIFKPKPEIKRLSRKNKRAASSEGLIRLLVNEKPMIIPGCGSGDEDDWNNYFCEWSTFKHVLEKAGAGCDFAACCISMGPGSNSTLTPAPGPGPAPICLAVEPITA
ncbi:PHOsphatase [Gryganskiella cystojenkinii]|nr:PHOsphatase [Gryganskiella cystojenkinii]